MRLSLQNQTLIKTEACKIFGENAQIFLFGSRVDESKKGGDIDLLIESDFDFDLLKKARLKMILENQLNLPVDILTMQRGVSLTPFQEIALKTSVLL